MRATRPPELQITYLMRQLSTKQRKRLIRKLAIGHATFYRWQKAPGSMPADKFLVIQHYLSEITGEALDQVRLMKPVGITAIKTKTVAA